MSEARWLKLRPGGVPEAFSAGMPQAALAVGQPRPISRLGRGGRPYRALVST